MNPLLPGLGLTLVVALVSGALWGRQAAQAAGILGIVATLVQLAAHRFRKAPTRKGSPFPAGWLVGTALRLGAVVLFAVLVLADRKTFAPLPSALGLLGVMIPLLMLELRTTR